MLRLNHKVIISLCLAAIVGIFAGNAVADTITYQEGANDPFTGSPYAGTDDVFIAWLSEHVGQHDIRNYGANASLITGISYSGTETKKYKSLVRFDLTSLAGEYASIDSVKLRLNVTTVDVDHSNNLQLYRFTAANEGWVEGTSTGAIQTGSVCWRYRAYSSIGWSTYTPGTALGDYDGGTIATTAFDGSTPTGWMELVFTDKSFIGDWIAGNNPGMVLRVSDESAYSRLISHSSESTTTSLRPQLVIDYTPIPEPGTLALLATGLIGLLCYAWRKRK